MVEKFIHLDTGDIETIESFFSNQFFKGSYRKRTPLERRP